MFKIYNTNPRLLFVVFLLQSLNIVNCQQQQKPENKLHLILLNQPVFYSFKK